MAPNKATFTTKGGAGLKPLYLERQVKAWAITEPELDMVGTLDRMTTLFSSLATLAAGFNLGVWWNVATTPDPKVQSVGHLVMPIVWVAAAIFAGLVIYFESSRRSHIKGIQRDTTTREG